VCDCKIEILRFEQYPVLLTTRFICNRLELQRKWNKEKMSVLIFNGKISKNETTAGGEEKSK
jgi:hypothetical protein